MWARKTIPALLVAGAVALGASWAAGAAAGALPGGGAGAGAIAFGADSSGAAAGVTPAAGGAGIAETLAQQLATARSGDAFDVIVRLREGTQAPGAAQLLAAWNIQPRHRWHRVLNGFAARLTRAQIEALAAKPEVEAIQLDGKVRIALDTATYWTGVQAARADFGVSGDRDGSRRNYSPADVVVAVIDTGIDASHVDLAGGKVIGWYDGVLGLPLPYDDQGHGTHVAGIIAGTGAASWGRYAGVAPGAALVGVKVMDALGQGTESGVISGIEWVVANKERFRIRIANMSLGGGTCLDGTDALSTAVNRAVEAGILFVVAAGNSGPGACTVGSPAVAEKALTVGAVADPGEQGWALAFFSSRGPTKDGRIKPDVVAPGVNIMAPKAGSRNQYVAYSGTSMATPFVSGVAALVLSANPALMPEQVKAILTDPRNVKDFGPPGKDPYFGQGIIQPYAAVQAAAGRRGRGFSDQLAHSYWAGDLGATGAERRFNITVTDIRIPVALGLQVPTWQPVALGVGVPAFQLEVLDPLGRSVAKSKGGSGQETLAYKPWRAGTYTVVVRSVLGDGPFWLDASYR